MRKLKLQVQVSVDGYMSGPNGEMNFLTRNWDPELMRYVGDLTDPVDSIVLGRKLAQGFVPHWAAVAADPGHPEHAAGIKFNETRKIVFSKTLTEFTGTNTVVASGELAEEIHQLKSQAGGTIMAYGGAAFVAALAQQRLIDDYYLFVNPTAMGRGLSPFQSLAALQTLTLVEARPFTCGLVVLHYALA